MGYRPGGARLSGGETDCDQGDDGVSPRTNQTRFRLSLAVLTQFGFGCTALADDQLKQVCSDTVVSGITWEHSAWQATSLELLTFLGSVDVQIGRAHV